MERKEAATAGLKKYNTGRPCKHGHLADRYVDSGACSDCLKMLHKNFVTNRKLATDAVGLESSPRQNAASVGLKKYNTGQACKHGHMADRYVESGACVDCVRKAAVSTYAGAATQRELIASRTAQIFLFTKLSGLPAIKMLVDAMIAERLPHVAFDAVNPSPYWQKQVSRETYQIKVRVPLEDVDAAYAMGKLLLESEVPK
jgi:hypothetical protein